MEEYAKRLTREQYFTLLNMPQHLRFNYANDLDNEIITPTIKYGYGFYGIGALYEKDGEYFVNISIGKSCD